MRTKITLADVAREAGVSVQTASHVLSGNMTVRLPETTRAKVKKAAETVGYRPNRLAQAMKNGRSNVIAVWLALDRPNVNLMRMLEGITRRATSAGFDVMVMSLDRSMAYSGEGDLPSLWPVDGIIAIDAGKAILKLREDPSYDDIPVSVLGFEECVNGDSVAWKVRDGVFDAISRMMAAGKTDIVHVTPKWVIANYPREQRSRGYREALEGANLKPRFVLAEAESEGATEDVVAEFLRGHELPQAFFGFTDKMAIGAARAVMATGARVPEDCWITGYGDAPEASEFKIPLTTVRTPIDALFDQAVVWLRERIEDPSLQSRMVELSMEFVLRDSTGPM